MNFMSDVSLDQVRNLVSFQRFDEANEILFEMDENESKRNAISTLAFGLIDHNQLNVAISLLNDNILINCNRDLVLNSTFSKLSYHGKVEEIIEIFDKVSDINKYHCSKKIIDILVSEKMSEKAFAIVNLHTGDKKDKLYRNIAIQLAERMVFNSGPKEEELDCFEVASRIYYASPFYKETLSKISQCQTIQAIKDRALDLLSKLETY